MLMNASLEEKFSFSFSRPVSLGTLAGWLEASGGGGAGKAAGGEGGSKVTGV